MTDAANCRGRDPRTRAHVPLGCDGLAPAERFAPDPDLLADDPEFSAKALAGAAVVERRLGGGTKCDVLHSHAATDYRDDDAPVPADRTCFWVSTPFAFDSSDDEARAKAAALVAHGCDVFVDAPPRLWGLDYEALPFVAAAVREPSARLARRGRRPGAFEMRGLCAPHWSGRATGPSVEISSDVRGRRAERGRVALETAGDVRTQASPPKRARAVRTARPLMRPAPPRPARPARRAARPRAPRRAATRCSARSRRENRARRPRGPRRTART